MMKTEIAAADYPVNMRTALGRTLNLLAAFAWRGALALVLLAAWLVSGGAFYTPGSDFGYWLGVAGGSLMLVLLVYPLRKRYRALDILGPLRHWFRFHLVAGIAGPSIILFHSTFHVGSFNAAIALASMLLVVASGIVGRYLYRKIHNGLYGSRASAAELQASLSRQMAAVAPQLARLPDVALQIERYSALVSHEPAGRWAAAAHFLSLGWRRRLAGRRVRAAIERYRHADDHALGYAPVSALAETIEDALAAVQRCAQLSTYERLFRLWHVIHIPFLCLLAITAVVHVVAVHAY
jgi:hypothetical protein